MDASSRTDEVFEATVFLSHFRDLPDSRQAGKVIYPPDEVLLLALLATLAGAAAFTDIARFGEKKLALLRRFRPFKDGTPPHDRIGDIFAALDAAQFQRCFVAWVAAVTGMPAEVIAIDGKTARRSGSRRDDQAPIHMVSAFAARQRLVLGQVKVADKSNEIMAIPKLLTMLAIEGAIVTIDAMGCQREIARTIRARTAYAVLFRNRMGSEPWPPEALRAAHGPHGAMVRRRLGDGRACHSRQRLHALRRPRRRPRDLLPVPPRIHAGLRPGDRRAAPGSPRPACRPEGRLPRWAG